jgi:hypothetical protein
MDVINLFYILIFMITFEIVFFGAMWIMYWIRKDNKVVRRYGDLNWCDHCKALLLHTDDSVVFVV